MLKVYLIRHAESEGNVNNHLIGGQSNHFKLTERGEKQAKLLGERLVRESVQFDQVYASTAVRARETARFACKGIGISVDQIRHTENLLELSQGEWEGQIRKNIYTPERLKKIRSNGYHFKAPGGESPFEVETRMFEWFESACKNWDEENPMSIAAFSHGFAIKALTCKIMNVDPSMSWRTIIHNTAITCFQYRKETWYAERINDFGHLAGLEFVDHYG